MMLFSASRHAAAATTAYCDSIVGMLMSDCRPLTVLLLLVVAESITEGHWTETESEGICGGLQSATSAQLPSSLQRLLISFLPALTENKGRSKHVVGAFKCALNVSRMIACFPLTISGVTQHLEAGALKGVWAWKRKLPNGI